ncbi:hypothetical protein [Jiangella mangrovi]|uniref:Uncharacterized protein n=1 Tax=Jiangella mangrovi TaxID=1524084 RepID=A0A7W9LNJ0_9ACTN|nr:hypothetical protein [Jiangella mangrovi]MBB5790331.1 hypothetical protein [Jiangella mangrovi]
MLEATPAQRGPEFVSIATEGDHAPAWMIGDEARDDRRSDPTAAVQPVDLDELEP